MFLLETSHLIDVDLFLKYESIVCIRIFLM